MKVRTLFRELLGEYGTVLPLEGVVPGHRLHGARQPAAALSHRAYEQVLAIARGPGLLSVQRVHELARFAVRGDAGVAQ